MFISWTYKGSMFNFFVKIDIDKKGVKPQKKFLEKF